ncbi:MAG TPA: endolytic transglycosylase MltG [Thermoanaerobaculia bacterium]|nr:endolytic transglycosylase MltG [Thermoanaerobaculia bacterium]
MTAKRKAKRPARKRSSWRGILLGWLVFLLLLAVPAGLAGYWVWRLQQPYQGYPEAEREVTVEPGTSAVTVLGRLEREGVLVNAGLARVYLVYVLHDPPIQAGDYLFHGPLTMHQVLRKLIRGDVISHRVTLVEGLTLEETAAQLAAANFGQADVFLARMRSPELIADLDPAARDLEGYLFPETYVFVRGTPEVEIVRALVRTFRARFARDVQPLLAVRPRAGGVRELVTLASIVEKEAKLDPERPLIAAVYQNRLDRRIGLAADPTVIYAMKRLGTWNGNITKQDLQLDSPWNTYRVAGLPPSPICSPGLASLKAAADPARVPYLYFVSRNDGTHVFAQTLAEHSRNVDLWQRQYWRNRRAQERRAAALPSH